MDSRLLEIAKGIEDHPYERTGHIYHPIPFPEFAHLKTSSSARAAWRKWKLIKSALGSISLEGKRVLDVGASAGFYSFNFAKEGAIVDAFEPHGHYAEIGRKIVEVTGLSVNWHNQRLTKADLVDKEYDITLMLSVFQWISGGNENLEEACTLLEAIAQTSQTLFFELGCNYGKSAICTHERPIAWIWRLLCHHTFPKQVSFLGITAPWRDMRRYVFACSNRDLELKRWQRLVTWALQKGWIK